MKALRLISAILLLGAITAQADTLTCIWEPPDSEHVAGYKVYVAAESGAYTNGIDVGNVLSYTTTADLTKDMFMVVTAYNSHTNESVFSREASWIAAEWIAPPPPNAVRIKITVQIEVE